MLYSIFDSLSSNLEFQRSVNSIDMKDMSKIKKIIERRKYKATKRGGFYAKYKIKK